MSTFIPNQPILFDNSATPACSNIDYTQVVDFTDVTQFQFKLDVCPDADNVFPLFNEEDWYFSPDADVPSGGASVCLDGSGTGAVARNNIPLVDGQYYVLYLNVTDLVGELQVRFGTGNTIKTITGNGEFEVFGFANGDDLEFFLPVDSYACLSNLSLFNVSIQYGIAIRNSAGTVIESLWLEDYIADGEVIENDIFNLTDGYLTVSIDWANLDIDTCACYTICIVDPCIQTQIDTDLCDADKWDLDDLGEPSVQLGIDEDCVLYFLDSAGSNTATAESLVNTFVSGTKYEVTYTITGIGATSVWFQIGTNMSTLQTTNGTFTEIVEANGAALIFNFESTNEPPCAAYVSNLIIHVADEDLECDYSSQQLKVCDTTGSNSLLINACNDTDTFGFKFDGSGFSPLIRLDSALIKAQYPAERKVEENTSARLRNTFFQRRKRKQLVIMPVPEYIHDFLSLLPGFDHFYIDNTEYVVDEENEYVVEYSEGDDNVGSVKMDVRIKEDLIRNKVCAEEGAGCTLPPNYILTESGLAIAQEDDVAIETE